LQFIRKPFFVLIVLAISAFGTTFPDSYYKISSTSVMKQRFISIMLPVIQKENAKILKEREFIENTLNKNIFSNKFYKYTPTFINQKEIQNCKGI
jgi:uncharacterized FlgJ-related protein